MNEDTTTRGYGDGEEPDSEPLPDPAATVMLPAGARYVPTAGGGAADSSVQAQEQGVQNACLDPSRNSTMLELNFRGAVRSPEWDLVDLLRPALRPED